MSDERSLQHYRETNWQSWFVSYFHAIHAGKFAPQEPRVWIKIFNRLWNVSSSPSALKRSQHLKGKRRAWRVTWQGWHLKSIISCYSPDCGTYIPWWWGCRTGWQPCTTEWCPRLCTLPLCSRLRLSGWSAGFFAHPGNPPTPSLPSATRGCRLRSRIDFRLLPGSRIKTESETIIEQSTGTEKQTHAIQPGTCTALTRAGAQKVGVALVAWYVGWTFNTTYIRQ